MPVDAIPTAPVLGRLDEFNPQSEEIATYLERLQLYFDANGVADDKKVSVLLVVVGAKVYDTLRSLLAPDKPKDQTFDALLALLEKHYAPKPLVIAERFRFYQRSQKAEESVADFLAELRRLSIRCDFGAFLDQALRDRLVCGIRSPAVQKRLLAEDKLTLSKAVEIAQSIEAADSNARQLKGAEQQSLSHHAETVHMATVPRKPCYRCGRKHLETDCKFKNATCHYCGKTGHIAPACGTRMREHSQTPQPHGQPLSYRPKKPSSHKKRKKPAKGTQWVGDVEPKDPNEHELAMFTVNGTASQPPIVVTMNISGKSVPMELDTGATVSIMPMDTFVELFPGQTLEETSIELKSYTGEQILVRGEVTVQVTYQSQPPVELPLIVVDGSGPSLLGRNWLLNQHLQLDWSRIKAVSQEEESLTRLLQEFGEVFRDELGTIKPFTAKLFVDESAQPRFHRPRTVPYALRARVEEELDRLERAGVIEKVTHSEWAAPIVAVPKRDGGVRVCGDYKVTVNPVLDVDQYPLPRPDDLFATLAGGKYFTKLDLSHAYNQLVLDEESRKYLTINTHRGLYRYTRLPFGVASAPAIFQKTMDQILAGLDGVICYIDDILISGKSKADGIEKLKKVLQRLQEHGIRLKMSKCAFFQSSVQYLGHLVDAEGLHATDDKLKAIQDAPVPQNLTQLKSFLGLVNYYGRFIANLSTLLHPLNQLQCQDTPWKWSKECDEAFKVVKSKLASADVLVHYDPSLPIRLAGDASAYGIGAVISHVMEDGTERPIAFASRTLLPAERNYSQVEKEALSLIFGVTKFHTYLYGRRFTLVTDHKPLTTIFGSKKGIPPITAARIQRWAVKLSAYTYDITFRRTTEHANADGLSRLPLNSISTEGYTSEPSIFNVSQLESLPVTAAQVATATRQDPVLSKVYSYTTSSWPSEVDATLVPFLRKKEELTVEKGCILWGTRVVVPEKFHDKLLQELHRDHPGIVKMKYVARSYFWWPGLDSRIESLAQSCHDCLAAKNSTVKSPLLPWTWPERVYQRIHIDFAGPFQGTNFLVVVDAFSKWPEVFIMPDTSAEKTIENLRSLFATNGFPEQLVSDNGRQFTSEQFAIFLKKNGVKHSRSAPYHPATNGLAERFVQSLKQSLKATQPSGLSLSHRLCNFLITYRSSVHATTGVTPASLFLKREMRIRFDLIRPDTKRHVLEKQSQQKTDHDKHSRARQFFVGDHVMVKNYRSGPNWLPAIVVERLGPLSYLVQTSDQQIWRRHIEQVKRRVEQSSLPTSDEVIIDLPASVIEQSNSSTETTASDGSSEGVAEDSASQPQSGRTSTRCYPTRSRGPPNYFQPNW